MLKYLDGTSSIIGRLRDSLNTFWRDSNRFYLFQFAAFCWRVLIIFMKLYGWILTGCFPNLHDALCWNSSLQALLTAATDFISIFWKVTLQFECKRLVIFWSEKKKKIRIYRKKTHPRNRLSCFRRCLCILLGWIWEQVCVFFQNRLKCVFETVLLMCCFRIAINR